MTNFGKVRKIAVLRANGIGDYIFCLPALDALRATFPGAEIVLLGKAWHRTYLTGRPGAIDRVVELPAARGVGAPEDTREDTAALDSFFHAMRAERFDLAFQLHGGGRWSNPFIKQLGARHTFGLCAADAEPLEFSVPYIYYQPEVFRYLEVVALAGARPAGWEPRMSVTDEDLAAARAVLPAGKTIAVLHLGASDPRRRWPAASFAAVGDALGDAGAMIVVNATGDERPQLDELAENMRHPFIDLGPDSTLSLLTGVLAQAALIVANDSGPLHLARAVGTASVGIYWCGNLINAGPTSRTQHRPLLSWRLACPECGANTIEQRCEHTASFVADIPPEDAIGQALDLLAAETQPAAASLPRVTTQQPLHPALTALPIPFVRADY
ncbi:glycosyltransferase family 9 protein [Aromatoleum buckelii]|uniref:Glycosyltransferase family 9 protein n=1 Tax=Aromatoleum buckelii TaxID=200254 RepID=A0ABX1MYT1_9RHOO|nr:glycosyltransferase family 9 protein [Aromatoleum buckelii]MCK0513110.1 glycosyltransferase family 9 protein [Aromatoleum buckelii]